MDRATAEGEGRYSGSPLGTQQGEVDLVLPAGGGLAAGVSRASGGGGGGGGGSGSGDGSTRVGGDLGAPATFLYKLCDILDEPHLSEHVAWNKEGDGIVVKQPAQFAKTVLPQYYKHNNFQSFVRQLNIYGFRKARHDKDSWEFKQPHFKRGQRHLLGLIRRKGGGGSANSGHNNSDNHNFSSNNNDTIEPPRKRHRDGSDVGVEETKDLVGRVTSELRAVCSRVVHLEAVMGMINHKHNHLRLESQALLRVVLSEGGQRLGEKAVAAVQQLPHTSGEPEMSELLSFLLLPSQGQREQNDQRQAVQQEQQQHRRHQHRRHEGAPETPEPPPPQPRNHSASTSASSDPSGDRHDYSGNDASGLTPLSPRRGSRLPADDEVLAPARVDPGGIFHPDHFLLGELAQAAVVAAAERAGGGPGGTSPFAGDAGGADSGVENTAGAGGGLRNAEAGAAPRGNAERESAASILLSDATAPAAAGAAAASPPAANDGRSSAAGQNQPSSDSDMNAVSGRVVGSTDSRTAGMHIATLQGPGPGVGTAAGVASMDVPLPDLLRATDNSKEGRNSEGATPVSVAPGIASRAQTESRKRPLGRGTEHAHGRESQGGGEGRRGADSGGVASSKRRIGRRR